MRIWTLPNRRPPVVILDCDNDYEANILNDLGHHNDTFIVTLKHNVGYLYPHLEIRKEKT